MGAPEEPEPAPRDDPRAQAAPRGLPGNVRARSLATHMVSFSLVLMGLAFAIAAVALAWRGGIPYFLLAFLALGLGAVIVLGGVFFQLVPLKLEALAELKRDYDRRKREGRD